MSDTNKTHAVIEVDGKKYKVLPFFRNGKKITPELIESGTEYAINIVKTLLKRKGQQVIIPIAEEKKTAKSKAKPE